MTHSVKDFPKTFSKFYGDKDTADVILVFNEKKYHVHKLVLALHSDVFKTLFYGKNFKEVGKREIKITNELEATPEIFSLFIRYLYSSSLIITQHNVVKLYELSDYYAVGHLKQSCITALYEEIKNGDFFPALEMVNKYYDEELLRLCISVISRTINDNMDHFCKNVSFPSLVKVLNNDYFNVGEEKVLVIAKKFIEYHGNKHATEIMKCIRFHLMPGHNIVKLMKPLVAKGYVTQEYFTECLVFQFDRHAVKTKFKTRRRGFNWDIDNMKVFHDCFQVSEDNLIVKRLKSSGVNPSIRTNIPLTEDNPIFQARLLRFNKWNCFGVCTKNFSLINEFVGNDSSIDSGFGIYIGSTTSKCYVKNNSKSVSFQIKQVVINENDILGLGLEDNCIVFYHNHIELGRATLSKEKVRYYPTVSMGYLSEWKIE